jgi:hypothetical protein
MAELQDRVYSAFQTYRADKGLIVIEGTSIGGIELDAQLASSLGAPALIIMGGKPRMSASDYFGQLVRSHGHCSTAGGAWEGACSKHTAWIGACMGNPAGCRSSSNSSGRSPDSCRLQCGR